MTELCVSPLQVKFLDVTLVFKTKPDPSFFLNKHILRAQNILNSDGNKQTKYANTDTRSHMFTVHRATTQLQMRHERLAVMSAAGYTTSKLIMRGAQSGQRKQHYQGNRLLLFEVASVNMLLAITVRI